MITPETKLRELVLYVGSSCALDQHYGVLKLNKILFYSDFTAYRMLGESITGVEYRKYPHGPAPAMMKAVRQRMHESNEAYDYVIPPPAFSADGEELREKRLLPRRAPNMKLFTQEQVALVSQVIEWLRPMTGTQVSRMSHRHPGWRLAKLEETIPYTAALLPESDEPMPLSASDRKWALAAAERFAAGQYAPAAQ